MLQVWDAAVTEHRSAGSGGGMKHNPPTQKQARTLAVTSTALSKARGGSTVELEEVSETAMRAMVRRRKEMRVWQLWVIFPLSLH